MNDIISQRIKVPAMHLTSGYVTKTIRSFDMTNNNTSGIYEIVNKLNGHRYVGSAVNIGKRWGNHIRDLNNNKHCNKHLQSAWNKYGADAFNFQVIELCFFLMLLPREQHYIDILCPEYNVLPTAGSNLGMKFSDEARANMSAAHKGLKYSSPTAEARANISAARMGKKPTPETKAKQSAAKMGKKRPPFTEEHKAKMSASMKGKKKRLRTAEEKAKMSMNITAWWARRKQEAKNES